MMFSNLVENHSKYDIYFNRTFSDGACRMEAEQNTSLPYDILTGECEAAIRKHLARTELLDSTGLELEQAKAYAVLSLWFRLACAARADREVIDADRQRLMLMIDEYQTMRQQ